MRSIRRQTVGGPALPALLVLFAALPAACSHKGVEGGCSDETAACADSPGDPTGTWKVSDACIFDADQPFRPMSLNELTKQPQNPSIVATQAQPTTDGNWCSDLILKPPIATNPATVKAVNLFHGLAQLQGGTVAFKQDGTYAVDLAFFSPGESTHFAPTCLQYAGNTAIDCANLGPQITSFYTSSTTGTQVPSFRNISCQNADDGGCDCGYDYFVELTDSGTWLRQDNVIVESSTAYLYNGHNVESQAPTLDMFASFCQSGTSLTMTGYQGSALSQVGGLRTLFMQRM